MASILLVTVGCAGVQHSADYRSEVRHQDLGLKTSVTVLVAPEVRKARGAKPERFEYVRKTLQNSLRRDLADNGPLAPVIKESQADLRLVVVVTAMKHEEMPYWIMGWFLAPLWLLGMPMNRSLVGLSTRIELTNAEGQMLYQTTETSQCTRLEGVYYGHKTLTFGCPAREISERLRDEVSLDRSMILAGTKPRSPPTSPKSNEIAAVFHIRDLSEGFETKLIGQLSEFLSAQVGQRLGFKLVPRQTMKARLVEAKADSLKACYDEACQIELGKAVAATKIVSTNLIRVGDRCVFNAIVYDLRTESADRSASAETPCADGGLLDGVRAVVSQLSE